MIDLVPLTVCTIAAGWDLRTREIPDMLPVILIVGSIGLMLWSGSSPWWAHLIGGAVALLIACLVGRGDRFGGGDVKLFAALGCWFGIKAVFPLAIWIALAGMLLAFLAAFRKQSDYAYGPAILIGVSVHVLAPDLLARIAG